MSALNIKNKLTGVIVSICLLLGGLGVTTYAIVSAIVRIENNRFVMSEGFELSINNGTPIITADDFKFEPGCTVVKEFPITNEGSFAIEYRVYFTDMVGELKDAITVSMAEKDGRVLCNDRRMSEVTKDSVIFSDLAANETKTIVVSFHLDESYENDLQGKSVEFSVSADAIQKDYR